MDRDIDDEFRQHREHFELLDDIVGRRQGRRARNPSVFKRRLDPLSALSDTEFKSHYRVNKPTVLKLAEVLGLAPGNFRGRPLSAVQQVCVALNFYGGGHFTRVAGLCQGVSQKAAWWAIRRVTNKLCEMKDVFIVLPTDEEMAETANDLYARFGLPRFAWGIDCVVVKFTEAPRKIPEGTVKQNFWSRKMCYGLNVQIVGNHKRLILDIDANWFGSANDARIWKNSAVKTVIESQQGATPFLLAGDSAYPLSPFLITPYTTEEALNDPTKRRFNRKLSGLRTVVTENVFGVMKRRFPVLNMLRANRDNARKHVIAIACVHNICIRWDDEDPNGPPPPPTIPPDVDNAHHFTVDATRLAGLLTRDELRLAMDTRGRR